MRKTVVVVAVAVLGTAAVVLGSTIASANASDSNRHGSNFTVVERAITDTVADTGPKGDSLGDILAFANPIYNAGNVTKVGSDNGTCTRTKVAASWECAWTTTLKGGSLVVEGPFYDTADSTLAIIGGTGAWSGARGEMKLHARNAQGSEYDFVFSVERG